MLDLEVKAMPAKPERTRTSALRSALLWAGITWFLLRAVLCLGNGDLWLDEILGLSFFSKSFAALSLLLVGPGNAHFPTWFVLGKIVTAVLPTSTLSPTVYARFAAVSLYGLTLLFTAWRVERSDSSGVSGFWALGFLLLVTVGPHWGLRAIEAKQQGLMFIASGCAVVLLMAGAAEAAAYASLVPMLMHPFGLMIGAPFIPALLAFDLLGRRRDGPGLFVNGAGRRVAAAYGAAVLLVVSLMFVKFVLFHTVGFSLVSYARPPEMQGAERLVAALPLGEAGATAGALAAILVLGAIGRRRVEPRGVQPVLWTGFCILLAVLVFAALLLLLKPSTPPYTHYVEWIVPTIHLITLYTIFEISRIVGAVGALRRWVRRHGWQERIAAPAGMAALLAAMPAVGSAYPLGFSDTSLSAAARLIDGLLTPDTGIAGTNIENIVLPKPYARGLKCSGGTLITMYLSDLARAATLCQGPDWIVRAPPAVRRLIVVDEAGAYTYLRRIDLTGFHKQAVFGFGSSGQTIVTVYQRIPAPDS